MLFQRYSFSIFVEPSEIECLVRVTFSSSFNSGLPKQKFTGIFFVLLQVWFYFSYKRTSEKRKSACPFCLWQVNLTHWGRVTHICVGSLNNIGSDNGLSPARRQAIILTNAGILLIRPLGTNFSEIAIEIITFSFKKIHLKMSFAKMSAILSRPLCLNSFWLVTWSMLLCVMFYSTNR